MHLRALPITGFEGDLGSNVKTVATLVTIVHIPLTELLVFKTGLSATIKVSTYNHIDRNVSFQ